MNQDRFAKLFSTVAFICLVFGSLPAVTAQEQGDTTALIGTQTRHDFQLAPLYPGIVVTPSSMEETLVLGDRATQTLTIANTGQSPLEYNINEIDHGYTPLQRCEERYGGGRNASGATRDAGNLFEVSQAITLSEIGARLNPDTTTDLYFFVYEGATLEGLYDQIHQTWVDGIGPGEDWYSSGQITVSLQAGMYYYVGASWNADTQFWSSNDLPPYPTACMGTLHTGVPSGLAGYPPAEMINNPYGSGVFYSFASLLVTSGVDVPWVGQDPAYGTVQPGTEIDIDVTFDAGAVPISGTYLAEMRITHNDPLSDNIHVPVTMIVPSADMGKVEGIVSGLGYCDQERYPLETEILIESRTGMTWTRPSDANGYYDRWLNAGTYTLTASVPEHRDAVAVVQIAAGQTTTQDLDLRLVESCLEVTPHPYELAIPIDLQVTETLSIGNDGAGTLQWEIGETTRTVALGFTPPGNSPVSDRDSGSPERAPTTSDAPAPAAGESVLNGRPAFGIRRADYGLYTWPDIDDPGTWSHVGPTPIFRPDCGDFAGGDFSTLYVLENDPPYGGGWLNAVDTATGVTTLIGPCGPGCFTFWRGMAWDPTRSTMYAVASDLGSYSYLCTINLDNADKSCVGTLTAPIDVSAIAVDATGQMYGAGNGNLLLIDKDTAAVTVVGPLGDEIADIVAMDFDEESDILYVVATDTAGNVQVGVVNTDTGAATLIGTIPDESWVSAFAIQAWAGEVWFDVPWVSEEPTAGPTPADSVDSVDVVFDTTGLTAGACYTASLGLLHDDPGQPDLLIFPLTLCAVLPQAPIASFESNSPVCPGEAATFADTSGNYPTSWSWDFGDGSSSTRRNPTHTYAAAGTYDVSLEACNAAGCDAASGPVQILPTADFYYVPQGLTVFFRAGEGASSYMWNLGDGSVAAIHNPVHTYAAGGTYTVTLTILSPCGPDQHQAVVQVAEAVSTIYLPLVVKND